ncbi:MAG: hypothetical protein GY951_12595 [Psychromonas sp.]|nr:hypothetical protein [Psychromonas sp.]
MKKSATLFGYHGKQNIGDDIFLTTICHWLATRDVCHCYVKGASEHIPTECQGVSIDTFENPIKQVSRLQWLRVFQYALKSDYFIFAAGSIFTIQPFFIVYLTLLLLRVMRGRRLKIYAIGVSIGPFRNLSDQRWCRKAFALMNHILLRDDRSAELMSRYFKLNNWELAHDLALPYLLKNSITTREQTDPSNIIIGLSITKRGYGGCKGNHTDACDAITAILSNKLSDNHNISVRLYSVCSDLQDGDLELCKHLKCRLKQYSDRIEIHEYDTNSINRTIVSIHDCDAMVSYRMHAGVIALFSAVPLLQLSYSEKIRGFFDNNHLDKSYLYDDHAITTDVLEHFLSAAISGDLSSLALLQRQRVMSNAIKMKEHLFSIS